MIIDVKSDTRPDDAAQVAVLTLTATGNDDAEVLTDLARLFTQGNNPVDAVRAVLAPLFRGAEGVAATPLTVRAG